MSEIVFLVEECPEGGYLASANSASIFTQADDLEQLKLEIVDAISCHFSHPQDRPERIKLEDESTISTS